jgi:hypothetical protein
VIPAKFQRGALAFCTLGPLTQTRSPKIGHAYDAGITLFLYGIGLSGQVVIRRDDAVLGDILNSYKFQTLRACEALRMVYGLLRDRTKLLFKDTSKKKHSHFFQKAS